MNLPQPVEKFAQMSIAIPVSPEGPWGGNTGLSGGFSRWRGY